MIVNQFYKLATDLRPWEPNKDTFHLRARKMMRQLAMEAGMTGYDLRTNKAGPAVLGETTLHSCTVYVQTTERMGIMVRSVKGLKDYTGGRNHFVQYGDPEGLLKTVKTLSEVYV